MNYTQIKKLQKEYGFADVQESINSGQCWKMEGSVGRNAMALLESGGCMLPLVKRVDYYGNIVPPRNVLIPGTKGTYKNSVRFWSEVEEGKIEILGMFAEVDD